jgi:hypothetical protein
MLKGRKKRRKTKEKRLIDTYENLLVNEPYSCRYGTVDLISANIVVGA